MSQEPVPNPQTTLERCIVENSNDAWAAFLSEYAVLIRRVYHAHADAGEFVEFEGWFPGWLYHERKLHSAYRALQARIRDGECLREASQQRYLSNYVATIVRSAAAEFVQERRPQSECVPDSHLARHPAAQEPDDRHLREPILAVLPRLPAELRVPFWLRYVPVFGPLSPEDAAWVAERSGLTAEQVGQAVAGEVEANLSRQHPLSSEFIGSLVNIPPCGDGRYSTVDQRVRRAIVRIRELLLATGEGRGT
jgi:hypothetical protein